jgi:FkbM family methyltransferase
MRALLWSCYKAIARRLSGRGLGSRFRVLQTLNNLFVVKLRGETAHADGHTFYLPANDKSIVANFLAFYDSYEPLHTEIAKREIRPGDVVLDIGANIGYFTLLFAKLVGRDGAVFAFEPTPDTFALASKNVELNGYSNVTLVQKALSNRAGRASLVVYDDIPGKNRLTPGVTEKNSIEVETVRLDDYFANYSREISFIKIDVEGAELLALEGGRRLLGRNHRLKILTEFIVADIKEAGADPEAYLRLLLDSGFELFELKPTGVRAEPVSVERLLRPDTATNLFCVRA